MKITNERIQSGIFIVMMITLFITAVQTFDNKRQISHSIFFSTLHYYDSVSEETATMFSKIKDVLKNNPRLSWEVHDKQDTLSYLLIRLNQPEPLYAIELGLLEQEIKSLNLLNELCKSANDKEKEILRILHSKDVSYYQYRKSDLLLLYEKEKNIIRLSKPHFDCLDGMEVGEYFD